MTWNPTHRHKKRGTTYRIEGFAGLQSSAPIAEPTKLVIYRGEDGQLWARPIDEFLDGRFEKLPMTNRRWNAFKQGFWEGFTSPVLWVGGIILVTAILSYQTLVLLLK